MPKTNLLQSTVTVSTNIGTALFKKLVQLMFLAGVTGAICVVALVALVAVIIK